MRFAQARLDRHKLQPNAQVFHCAAYTVFRGRVFVGFHDGRSATPVQMLLDLLHLLVWLQQLDLVINLRKFIITFLKKNILKVAGMCLQASPACCSSSCTCCRIARCLKIHRIRAVVEMSGTLIGRRSRLSRTNSGLLAVERAVFGRDVAVAALLLCE